MNPLIVAYGVFLIAYILRELFLRRGKVARNLKRGKFDKGSTVLGGIGLVTILIGTPLLNSIGYGKFSFGEGLRWIGVFITLLAVALQYWSVITLSKYYTRTLVMLKNQHIVQTGPYKFVRHPGYLGYLLGGIGFGLSASNWIVLLTIETIMLIVLRYRIKAEEKMLLDSFGQQYKNYMKETKMLIPFIY